MSFILWFQMEGSFNHMSMMKFCKNFMFTIFACFFAFYVFLNNNIVNNLFFTSHSDKFYLASIIVFLTASFEIFIFVQKRRNNAYFSLLLYPICYFIIKINSLSGLYTYSLLILFILSFCLLYVATSITKQFDDWNYKVILQKSMLQSVGISVVIMTCFLIIVFGLNPFISAKINKFLMEKTFFQLLTFLTTIFCPLFTIKTTLSEYYNKNVNHGRLTILIIEYLISPVVMILLALLYGYIIKGLFTQEPEKGHLVWGSLLVTLITGYLGIWAHLFTSKENLKEDFPRLQFIPIFRLLFRPLLVIPLCFALLRFVLEQKYNVQMPSDWISFIFLSIALLWCLLFKYKYLKFAISSFVLLFLFPTLSPERISFNNNIGFFNNFSKEYIFIENKKIKYVNEDKIPEWKKRKFKSVIFYLLNKRPNTFNNLFENPSDNNKFGTLELKNIDIQSKNSAKDIFELFDLVASYMLFDRKSI